MKKKAHKQPNLFFDDDLTEIEGIEEDSLGSSEDIVSPFDPKDIKIIVEPKTIDHLVTRLRYNEIDLNTEFQRKGNLWKPEAQSRLIESILLRLPLPAFYFDAEDENNWLVVDGLQRLWTIKNFVVNSEFADNHNNETEKPLELTGLEILRDFSDKGITFNLLNRTMQRRILETPITTYLIQPGTPKPVKYNIYRRINTGGLGLNSMEIRHALNQGQAADFLKELSENVVLKDTLRLPDKRMEDRELYLRAISFIINDYQEYETPLSTYLDNTIEKMASFSKEELKNLKEKVVKAVLFQYGVFGRHMFSRSIVGSKVRAKLNSALFEVWVASIAKLTKKEIDKLLDNMDLLTEDYKELLLDDSLYKAIATSTSGKGAVRYRFLQIGNIIRKYSK